MKPRAYTVAFERDLIEAWERVMKELTIDYLLAGIITREKARRQLSELGFYDMGQAA